MEIAPETAFSPTQAGDVYSGQMKEGTFIVGEMMRPVCPVCRCFTSFTQIRRKHVYSYAVVAVCVY